MAYRVLIMTASMGNGHQQAAKAAALAIQEHTPDSQVQLMDFFQFFQEETSAFIRSAYIKMIDYLPNGYRLLYHLTARMKPGGSVTDAITWRLRKKVLKAISAYQPHYILFTDPFSAALVLPLKKQGKLTMPMGMIITDYTAHPLWLNPGLDQYFVACSALKQEMLKQGVPGRKISVTGIPVAKGFQTITAPAEIRQSMGLSLHQPLLLLMGGGLGLGSLDRVLDTLAALNRPFQVIVVTGKNQELYELLTGRSYPAQLKVRVLGFCTNIHQLMAASDLLISKAGGLTLSEAMCSGLPVLVYDPLPGQEVANARLLVTAGTARLAQGLSQVESHVEELLFSRPQEREAMAEHARLLGRPQAAKAVAQRIHFHIAKAQRALS